MATKKKAVAPIKKGLRIAVINRKYVTDYDSFVPEDFDIDDIIEYFELQFDFPMPNESKVFHPMHVRKT